jgi:xylulokinase
VFDKTRWFANGQEYFLYQLGADEWVTDPASLTLNGMMEIRKLDWSDRVLGLCGIGRDRLPPVGVPSGVAGKVSRQAAERPASRRGSRSAAAPGTSNAPPSGRGWCGRGWRSSPSAHRA